MFLCLAARFLVSKRSARSTVSRRCNRGHPPYNIEQIGKNRLRITLAVAGFSDNDLSIQLEDNQLVIRGRQEDVGDRVFLHRGIAARQFQRNYVLAEGIEVEGAHLDNGLLHVELARPEPEIRVRKIEINTAKPAGAHDGTLEIDHAAARL